MSDIIDETGLQTKTLNEIIADLEAGFKEIYGVDINIDQNSPDGQLINIFAQSGIDIRELITGVYNSYNPDRAIGVQLDERVLINNITRKGGTYTIQPIVIVTDRTVSLVGLDDDFNNQEGEGYTVQDNAGNEFILIDSDTLTAGTHTLSFRARNIGLVETTVGTITTPVTIVLGVVSVNNASGALQVGTDQETDAQLRVRRSYSTSLNASAYLNGLLGTVLNIDGVSDAKLYENYTSSIDADGIPAHGFWLIAEGGANTDIADAIYKKKSYGSNMKGDVSIEIITASGQSFYAKFDRPVAKDLYIKFSIQPIASGQTFDLTALKNYIVSNLSYSIGESAESSKITCVVKDGIAETGGLGVPVLVEISDDDITYVEYLETDTKDEEWTVDATRIEITVIT